MEKEPILLQLLNAPLEEMNEKQLSSYVARLQEVTKKDIGQIVQDEARGRPEYRGFLYVLSNPAMPELLKIGVTSGQAADRAKDLSRPTGVPECFVVECYFPIYEDLRSVELKVHDQLDPFRSNSSREFFRLPIELAEQIIEAFLKEVPQHFKMV